MTNLQYMRDKLLPQIKGAKVVDIISSVDDGFALVVQRPAGKLIALEVLCDPEGNGPGWINPVTID